MSEVYVSTDIEADGPIPGPYSMLSLGSAAFLPDQTMIGTFSVNLETLPGAGEHPDTMAWWQTQPVAWAACREDQQSPGAAMADYCAWLKELPGRPVFVAYPLGFDFTFVYWYLMRFCGESPFSFAGVDMKTYAMVLLDSPFFETVKSNMPRRWFAGDRGRPHVALDDALAQGMVFCQMLAERQRGLE